jgi:hypothetical protein
VKLRLRIPHRALLEPGNLAVIIAFQVVQEQDRPVAFGKFVDGAAESDPIDGARKDPRILHTAAQHNQANVGIYAAVMRGGTVRRGDAVRLGT